MSTLKEQSEVPKWSIVGEIFLFGPTDGVPAGKHGRVLVLWPGMEPVTPAMGAQSLKHWTAREVLGSKFKCTWIASPAPKGRFPQRSFLKFPLLSPMFPPFFCKNMNLFPSRDLFPLQRPLGSYSGVSNPTFLWKLSSLEEPDKSELREPTEQGVVQVGEHRPREVMGTSSLPGSWPVKFMYWPFTTLLPETHVYFILKAA